MCVGVCACVRACVRACAFVRACECVSVTKEYPGRREQESHTYIHMHV